MATPFEMTAVDHEAYPAKCSPPTEPIRLKKDAIYFLFTAQNLVRHPKSPLKPLFRTVLLTDPLICKLLSFVEPGTGRNEDNKEITSRPSKHSVFGPTPHARWLSIVDRIKVNEVLPPICYKKDSSIPALPKTDLLAHCLFAGQRDAPASSSKMSNGYTHGNHKMGQWGRDFHGVLG
ncbi:hypothetical protein M0657_012131 [Pyricularia oryzae]|nr:hypothetical protein M0657_012131 [Pyricularia oryzae]